MNKVKNIFLVVLGITAAIRPSKAWNQTPAGTAITNTAYLSYNGGAGVVLTMPTNTVITPVVTGTLHVTKTADKSEVSLGDTLSFEMHVQNTGSAALSRVVVQDSLPGMLSYIDSKPSGSMRDRTIQWEIPPIQPGEKQSIVITCRVEKAQYQETIDNSALYHSEDGIVRRSNVVHVSWRPWPEAELEKTASPPQAYIGDTLTYTFRVRNTGPMPLTGVRVADTLPDGIDFISSRPDADMAGRLLTWPISRLAPGSEALLSFRAKVTQTASGDAITNRATMRSAESAADTSTAGVRFLGQGVGLEIIKEAPDSVYTAGDTLTYNLIINNSGVRAGHHIVVLDTLPPGLEYIRSTDDGKFDGGVANWLLPGFETGFRDTLQFTAAIRVPVKNGTTIRNETWAYSDEGARDSSSWKIRVISRPGVAFEKRALQGSASIGDTIIYSLGVWNTGTTVLTHVQVADSLPECVDFISSNLPVTRSGRVLIWNVGDLYYRQQEILYFRASVTSRVSGDSIRNVAYCSTDETGRTSSSAPVFNRGYGEGIDIIKKSAESAYAAGDTLTYDLIVHNGISRPGTQIVVRDTLPDELEYVRSTHRGRLQDHIVIWSLDNLEANYRDTLRVTAVIRVPIEDQTLVNNEVWAYSSAGARDSSHFEIVVTSLPMLTIEIHGPETASPGDTIRYMLVYSNTGTATAFEPVLRDTLPAYLRFVGASGSHGYDPSSQAVRWPLPSLKPGDRDTLYLDARILDDLELQNEIVNSAWLSCQHVSRTTLVRCAMKTVLNQGSLYIYKTVDRKTAFPGDTLTYNIRYGALNRDIRNVVRIIDALPREVRLIDEAIFSKPSIRMVSFDPATNQVEFMQEGLTFNACDSIILKAVVSETIDPGVQVIENTAMVYSESDTALTAFDARTRAKTQLVRPFLAIQKAVNRKVVESGDVLTYTVTCENRSLTEPLVTLTLRDVLPEGFRYQEGTSVHDSVKIVDPKSGTEGNRLLMLWTLPDTLLPGRRVQLKYRVIVGVSVPRGEHENRVTASSRTLGGILIQSGEAAAAVLVSRGAFDERGLILGKVYEDLNQNGLHDHREAALKNVELILEDGTRVRTDEFGKYSIPDVEHGQHVLRLNENTLPKGRQVCVNDFGFLNDPKSRIVLVPPGGMTKANFAVKTIEP